MRAKIVSSIFVTILLIGGFVVSVAYADTNVIGFDIILLFACIGVILSAVSIIEWLWR